MKLAILTDDVPLGYHGQVMRIPKGMEVKIIRERPEGIDVELAEKIIFTVQKDRLKEVV
jgi:hypothetical protein